MKKLAAITLAAGYSARFGTDNKLLAQIDGKPMISHVIDYFDSLKLCKQIIVINNHDRDIVSLCDQTPLRPVIAGEAGKGIGHSIATGIAALANIQHVEQTEIHGAMIILGDMPYIKPDTLTALQSTFDTAPHDSIVLPVVDRRRQGHPVIFSDMYFGPLQALKGDTGARAIIDAHASCVVPLETLDTGVLRDIDRTSDIE